MLKAGDRLGPYRIEGPLGEGGWGAVLRARDPERALDVALKVLLPEPARNPSARARFLREGLLAAKIAHPNVVRVHDVGEIDAVPFIAMELIEGAPMSRYLGSPAVPLRRRLAWLVEGARGLFAVHQAGLVHRDVKPANLVVPADGAVRLIDFGFAKSDDPADKHGVSTRRGVAIGTPAYMAPEQLAGTLVDVRADQFAWGLVGFALVTGARLRVLDPTLPPARALEERLVEGGASHAIAAVLLRAFSASRDDRFPSMQEAGDALQACLRTLPDRDPRLPLYCPRCAERLTVERTCPRCHGPETVGPIATATQATFSAQVSPSSGSSNAPSYTPEPVARRGRDLEAIPHLLSAEGAGWIFTFARPAIGEAIVAAHIRPDGLVFAFTAARRVLALDATTGGDTLRELPPSRSRVRCATVSPMTGRVWVALADGGIASVDPTIGSWTLVDEVPETDVLRAAAAGRDGTVFITGARPGGGVVYRFTHGARISRLETEAALSGVVSAEDGRALCVGGTALFKAGLRAVTSLEMPVTRPLASIARFRNTLFLVGAGGTAVRCVDARLTVDACPDAFDLHSPCAAGEGLAYAITDLGVVVRRSPERDAWERIAGPFRGEQPIVATAVVADTLTLVLTDGTIVRGARSR